MYREIWDKYKQALPDFPSLRRPLVGTVIKEIRVDKGIRQMDFAKQIGMNESTLKSIENDHQQATTVENLEKCARALNLLSDELILMGRERDPANCFVFKRSEPPHIKGIRKRKKAPQEWHQSMRRRFEDFDLIPCSPPISTKRDFFLGRVNLPPKRALENLRLEAHEKVMGFIAAGYNIKVEYLGKETHLTGNQGFALDGFFPHRVVNDDEDQAAVIYLMTKLTHLEHSKEITQPKRERSESLDIAHGISALRRYRSDRPRRLLPITHLADLTDSLNHEQILKLMRMKKGSSVISWEKIEDLLTGTGTSMEEFLAWCHHEEPQVFSVATAASRALIDLSYYGIKIYSVLPPNIRHDYFCGEMTIEGKGKVAPKSWQRKDQAMVALYVEEGELEITVGKHRSALPLLKGESIYFDGGLGYLVRNPADSQARAFFATYPAIPF